MEKTEKSGDEIVWAWKHLMQRLKHGYDDAPKGLTKLEVRHALVDSVRTDKVNGELAAKMLASLSERGYLLALQAEKGPHSLIVRDVLRMLNTKTM